MTTQEFFEGGQTSARTTEKLLQSRGDIGWAGGYDLRCVNQIPLGGEETGIYQFFSGLPNYSKDFYLSWCCSNFQHISKENPISFQQVSKVFQTKSQVPC